MGPARLLAVLAATGALTAGVVTGPAAASAPLPAPVSVPGSQLSPAYFVDDPEYYVDWREDDPPQDCFPGLNCEIEQVEMYVSKDAADDLVTVAYTEGRTDGAIPASPMGRVAVYLDTSGNAEFEYATFAPNKFFNVNAFSDGFMYSWNGSSWTRMDVEATWYRGNSLWGAIIPWRALGLTEARMAMEICDTRGACDIAPDTGTPRIDIKGAVEGLPPNAPSEVTVNYRYQKQNKAIATLTWVYEGPGGPNSILNYSYRVSSNGGKTWTPWKSSTSNRVIVTGLRKGQRGFFEVKAKNRTGYGPTTRIALRP